MLGFGLGRCIIFRIIDRDEDVAHAALLGLRETLRRLGLLFFVVGLKLRIIDFDLVAQAARLIST